MTSRERLLKAINGEKPDRVPVTLFIADQGHFLNQMAPEIEPSDYMALHLKVIEIQKQLGCDVFVRVLYGLMDPLSLIYGGLDVSQQTENWQVATEEIKNGSTLIQRSTIRTPAGMLTQDFSINESHPGTFMYGCTKHPILNEADLDIAMQYEPGIPEGWAARAKARIGKIKDALGDSGILGSWSPHGPFNVGSLLIPMEQLYMLPMTNASFYQKLMEFAIQRGVPYLRAIDAAGVDLHCIGGNVPGGFLGRPMYDEYILPYEKRYMDIVQETGTPGMYHNCGAIMALVDSYKALGARVVEPFSPPPLGDCADLEAVRRQVNGAYAMLSGIDQVNVLQKGTLDDVKRATAKAMNAGKSAGGGFIMQSVDFLEYGTPLENVEAYVKTALEHADY